MLNYTEKNHPALSGIFFQEDSSMGYPVLEINLKTIKKNATVLKKLCDDSGIKPAAVIKGFNALDKITKSIVESGFQCIASSRIPHLRKVKEKGYPVETMGLRIPMISEVREAVEFCDICLCSEPETVRRLDMEAAARHKTLKVVLMRDLGDLREGIIDGEQFFETACAIEKNYSHIHLLGVGTNLGCYGSVKPTVENLSLLVSNTREIERAIGRKLELVSGGGSTSIYLAVRGMMPEGINHLRIGGALMLRSEALNTDDDVLTEMSDEGLILKAEIVEIGEKPTYPIGELDKDCFGGIGVYEDLGVRRRALLALGAFDVGNHKKLTPLDRGVKILGGSSDHTIIDIHDSAQNYRLGGVVSFTLSYQAMLFATANDLVEKRFIE